MRKWNLVVAWPDVTAKRLPDHDYQVFEGKLYFSPKEKLDGLQHRDPVGGGEHPLEVRSPFEPSCCEGSPTGSRGSSDDTLGASRVLPVVKDAPKPKRSPNPRGRPPKRRSGSSSGS